MAESINSLVNGVSGLLSLACPLSCFQSFLLLEHMLHTLPSQLTLLYRQDRVCLCLYCVSVGSCLCVHMYGHALHPTLLTDLTLQTEQSVFASLLCLCGFMSVCPHVCTCMWCPEANFSYHSFLRCLSLNWHCLHHESTSQVLGLQAHITMLGFSYL